eukprot:jgi/Phyca11/14951/fgenesh1_pg.PHYCAscaffold_10_\
MGTLNEDQDDVIEARDAVLVMNDETVQVDVMMNSGGRHDHDERHQNPTLRMEMKAPVTRVLQTTSEDGMGTVTEVKWNGRFWAPSGNAGKKRIEKKKAVTKIKSEAPVTKAKKTSKRVILTTKLLDEHRVIEMMWKMEKADSHLRMMSFVLMTMMLELEKAGRPQNRTVNAEQLNGDE